LLLRPFVPFSDNDSRQQLKAFMVAKSDPGSYGKLETFVMPGDNPPEGPGLVAGRIQADPQVSAAQTLLCQQGSKCLYGNLLLIPVEQSLIYVRPLYVIAQGNELPLLKKIVVEFQGQVSIADDLNGALRGLSAFQDLPPTSGSSPPPTTPTTTPTTNPDGSTSPTTTPTTTPSTIGELLAQANQAFADANAALQKTPPDFTLYGQKLAEAQAAIQQAYDLSLAVGQAPTTTTSSTTTTTAPSA
jgi:uncharacterized membrane protein (UPF0182 family)